MVVVVVGSAMCWSELKGVWSLYFWLSSLVCTKGGSRVCSKGCLLCYVFQTLNNSFKVANSVKFDGISSM